MKKNYALILALLLTTLSFGQNAGDIIITEIMQNPNAVSDGNGEYFEIYNTTGASIDIQNWTISDLGSNSHTIASSVIVPANGFTTLGINDNTATNGNIAIDYEYGSSIALANGDDELILKRPDGMIIDEVYWDGGPDFPDPSGNSMTLNPGNFNSTDNNLGIHWCEATSAIGTQFGTPGLPNDFCHPICVNLGDLIFTEIMQNPNAVGDGFGEWFEIHNTTTSALDLQGFDIMDDNMVGEGFTIDASLIIPAGGYLVFANNGDSGTNGGITPDWAYDPSLTLGNGTDGLMIECDGSTIDLVIWDGGTNFPDPSGKSMTLNPGSFNATDNDDGLNWCEGTAAFGTQFGTPGLANDDCPPICVNPGDLIFTEIMQNPNAVGDGFGEWFEIHNTTSAGIDLYRFDILDDNMVGEGFKITASLIIPAGGYLVFANNGDSGTNGGITPDWAYNPSLTLGNGADGLQIQCEGNIIDIVIWDGGTNFPDPSGKSMSLDPDNLNATDNDDGNNWCEGRTGFGTQFGTPGTANDDCPPFCVNPGDLIFTEIMQNPNAVADGFGEWFEIHNTTGADIEMQEFDIFDDNMVGEGFTIDASLIIPAGGYLVFANNGDSGTNGGITPDWVYDPSLTLGNGADGLQIQCEGNIIDIVIWDGGTNFPDPSGKSMSLDPDNLNATDNDDGNNWCEGRTGFGTQFGTPGTANDDCPPFCVNPGDLIFTEIMQNPNAVADGFGEWFEIHNTTGADIEMQEFDIFDDNMVGEGFTIDASLIIPAGGYLVFANNGDSGTNGGITPDWVYAPSLTLGNGADGLQIQCESNVIDIVIWDGGTNFPDPSGRSMALNINKYNATDNDDGENWCEGTAAFGSQFGTPGADNMGCPPFCVNPGDLIFTEIMQNPNAVGDGFGEWFEIYNASAFPINLNGFSIIDDNMVGEGFTINQTLMIPVAGFLVFANNGDFATNGGVNADWVYDPSLTLGNGADGLQIQCEGNVIDIVIWDGGITFPDPSGKSMSLDLFDFNSTDNDDGSNWCEAISMFGTQFGTPGQFNDFCPLPCTLVLGETTAICDSESNHVDNYTATIAFTEGGTQTFTITSNAGIIFGDNPSQNASGLITITGVPEGTDLEITVTSASCDFTVNIESPICFPSTSTRIDTGDLIFTEIMQNPNAVADALGEWFEIHNTTENDIDLEGCNIIDDNHTLAEEGFTIDNTLIIPAGGYLLFANNGDAGTNGGNNPDWIYDPSLTLGNGTDGITIHCEDQTIDVVIWDNGATFPDPSGKSMTLDPDHLDEIENNEGGNWCEGTSAFGTQFGTPGLTNDECPPICVNPGDLVFTEIMQNPNAVADGSGEWFEIHNTTGQSIDLNGFDIIDDNHTLIEEGFTITGTLIIPAGGYLVFANNGDFSTNGGINPDWVYDPSLTLGNGTDGISIQCEGNIIDIVIWDNGATFPDPSGNSMTLDPDNLNSADNDNGDNWCEATSTFGTQFGTPGTANDECIIPCTLVLGATTATCDDFSNHLDTYTATLAFTGGGMQDHTIAVNSGTISGDDPSIVASGTITILGVLEINDLTIEITSESCDFIQNIESPTCEPFELICANTGDLIFTEIMQNPNAVADGLGEWFEIHNTTGADIDLQGYDIIDDNHTLAEEGFTITTSLIIPAGGYLVFANNGDSGTNGGITPDWVYDPSLTLGNGTDGITIQCEGNIIDIVIWDNGATFPDPSGKSMTLDPDNFNNADNDNGDNWCEASTAFGTQFGTPGADNDNCGSFFPICVNPGDLIFTEIMQNPNAVADNMGEWFEIYNTTTADIEMQEFDIFDDNMVGEGFTIDASLIIPSGGYLVFANNGDFATNGGIIPDWVYDPSLTLGNGTDGITIQCEGSIIDIVIWDDGASFPDPSGNSMNLNPDNFNDTDNDDGGNWCEATTAFGTQFGTPGADNDNCGIVCILVLGTSTATCDASTENIDTYTATFAFTGGGTETYTITPSAGTVAGDNPSLVSVGTIIITGIDEGTDLTLMVTSLSCDLTENLNSPVCETFDPGCTSIGSLIFTEIMQNPNAVSDDMGEWFEIYNTTAADIDLLGFTIIDDNHTLAEEGFTITETLIIPAGGYLVFANNGDAGTNGGITPDWVYDPSLTLGNGTDGITIQCEGSIIDIVVWDGGATFPDPSGNSMTLDPNNFDNINNDNGANWCEATTAFGSQFGTPGMNNDNCGSFNPDCVNIGDLIFTEIMQNPNAVADNMGEWFEIYNTTGIDIDLHGFDIIDDNHTLGEEGFTITETLIIPAGSYLVFANNGDAGTNGGIIANWVYDPSLTLGNGVDGITVQCDGNIIDIVVWDGGATFPDPNGNSMNLNPTNFNSSDNDNGANWCEATTALGDQFGTPGATNDNCGSFSPICVNSGDLVFTEIMQNPNAVADNMGEWFEIYNTTNVAIDLRGFDIVDDNHTLAEEGFTITEMLVIPAGGYLVFTNNGDVSTNGGVSADWVYDPSLTLGNGADGITIQCQGSIIDIVVWDGGDIFPDPSGNSMNLNPGNLNSSDNDNGSNWCEATTELGSQFGTPGAANDNCAEICPLTLGTAIAICDMNTECNDTYTVSISFNGGGAENYSITTSQGEVEGDNPSSQESGTISIIGVDEGTNLTVTINSDLCDFTIDIDSPACEPFVLICVNPGDLIFTEVMQNPNAVSDDMGEWFEIHNTTTEAIDLQGYNIIDDNHTLTEEGFTITESLIIPAGGYLVFANNGNSATNGGIIPDWVYDPSLTLGNGADGITIQCDGDIIDIVIWDGGDTFPDPSGNSMNLSPASFDSNDNDYGVNWCEATTDFGSQFATPGTANDNCGLDCPLELASITTVCDSISNGVDTYTANIDFSGGNTDTYSITSNTGTMTGDNPSTTASGTMTFTGIAEGTDLIITITSDSCNFIKHINPPNCAPFTLVCVEAGDLIFTEIMQNPNAVADDMGEWFEIHNTTTTAIDLEGYAIIDDNHTLAEEGFIISESLIIPAGGYLVFANNGDIATNGGIEADWVYDPSLTLGNGTDGITIRCGENIIDIVIWDDGATFPDPSGNSMNLDPASFNSGDNDYGINWCETSSPIVEDAGTPGTENDECDDCPLDLCAIIAVCDSITEGVDTYTTNISFFGGNTEIYTITTNTGVLTGDDPSLISSGTMTFVGAEEGMDLIITFTSDACNFIKSIESPVCDTTIITCANAGDIIFTEVMQNPNAVADNMGEWFEIHNTTATDIDLQGYDIIDDNHTLAEEGFSITESLILPAGGYLVFANNGDMATNGGVEADWVYDPSLTLGNGTDGITIQCDSNIIDIVVWDGGDTFPDPSGKSMNLNPDNFNATDNDDGANWCEATSAFGEQFGTPGADNDACGVTCPLELGAITAICDSTTMAVDTYTISIAFTGGSTEIYTITSDTGTISGDDPSAVAMGIITISGVDEGTNVIVTITSENCDLSTTIDSPICEPFTVDCANAGDIIFTEVMQNPNAVADNMGEWFEIHNTTATDIDLQGYDIIDDNHTLAEEGFSITESLILPTGGYLVFANNGDMATNGGVAADWVYDPSLTLGNGTDGITIQCDSNIIDIVVWDGGDTFPDPSGKSMNLNPDNFNATDNDDGANWCEATSAFGEQFGTPGADNDACGVTCPLELGAITAICDSTTMAVDTYTISIAFTGGSTEIYTITSDTGTISGDDPSAVAMGIITISGVDEGTNVIVTIISENCDLSTTIDSPICEPFTVDCANAGDIIFTEVMQNPNAVADNMGEWFEIHNTTATDIDLQGYDIIDDNHTLAEEGFSITESLILPTGGYLVFANNGDMATNGGVEADWVYDPSLTLGNGTDGITIQCDSNIIDIVVWDGGDTFPDPSGKSMNLNPDNFNATDNDDGANWCEATSAFGEQFGTPGAENDACGVTCPLELGAITAVCDSTTMAVDTYTISIAFTGGSTETYAITSDSGTISGDDPSAVAMGIITISGVDEGTNVIVTITGENCDLSTTIESPTCEPFTVDCANAGDIIFTEVMQNPNAVADNMGEWFEIHNTTATDIDLQGYDIIDDNHTLAEEGFSITESLILPAGGYLVFANNGDMATNGGVEADWVYDPSLTLGNGTDGITIQCDSNIIDIVVWDGGDTFPDPSGKSMNLNPDNFNATDNDDGANWCEATSAFGEQFGTPGADNDACGVTCPLELGAITAICDSTTMAVDTYTISIAFTGGSTEIYTITSDTGTISGDDPSAVAMGIITISGVDEGTNVIVTITSENCDLSTTIDSPICEPFTVDCANAGDIIFTEVMQNPNAVADNMGEWFEIHNTTATDIDLQGYDIIDDNHTLAEEGFSITESLILPADGYLVFANNGDMATNGGVEADWVYDPSLTLGNGTDGITIQCDSNIIDIVVWDGGDTFPDPSGKSMNLNPDNFNATDNDNGANWCEATSAFGEQFGTPGAENDACGVTCPLELGAITAVCDSTTMAVDTYTISIAFTGGSTETYAITSDSGTISGDDPSAVAMGIITISGVDEGTNVIVTITGENCDLSTTIESPTCEPFTVDCANAGDIIFTEVMQNPNAVADNMGEWFEIHNTTATDIDLQGYDIIDDNHTLAEEGFSITESLILPTGGYLVFANNGDMATNGGVAADWVYDPSLTLGNGTDGITIQCEGNIIDAVIWDDGDTFPDPNGNSMNLSPDSFNSTDNDNGENWCEAVSQFADDFGTPGSANDICPAPCPLELSNSTVECDGITEDLDTYTATISFTGGGTQTYSITTNSGSVSGDNPSSQTSGTIIVSGITEGTDLNIEISGGTCQLSATVVSAVCIPVTCAAVGSVILTEIMQNPSAVADDMGEWFELLNTTTEDINLQGWQILDDNMPGEGFTIATSLVIPAGSYLVFANNGDMATNGGVPVDYVYAPSLTLGNGTDGLQIQCEDILIDIVMWDDGATFPDPNGASMSLFLDHLNAVDNNIGAFWGTATTTYGDGDLGTPGAENNFSVAINEIEIEGLKVYPNPTFEYSVYISTTNTTFKEVELYTVLGKKIYTTSFDGRSKQVKFGNVNGGIYFLKIKEGNKIAVVNLIVH